MEENSRATLHGNIEVLSHLLPPLSPPSLFLLPLLPFRSRCSCPGPAHTAVHKTWHLPAITLLPGGCTSSMFSPCSSACYAWPLRRGFRLFFLLLLLFQASCFLSCPLLLLFFLLKLLKPPTHPSPLALYSAGVGFSLCGYWEEEEILPMAIEANSSLKAKLLRHCSKLPLFLEENQVVALSPVLLPWPK